MTKDEVIAKLKATESELRALGIDKLYLFGSFARDEATDESDVDVFFEMAPLQPYKIEVYLDAKSTIERELGRSADLGTRRSLHPAIKSDIESMAVRVF